MSVARDPAFQQQGPACHCQIDGKCLGWLSCSAYGAAMNIDDATLGGKRPSGCSVRRLTDDTSGGLTLPQVAAVARGHYGVEVEVHVGSGVTSPAHVARRLRDDWCVDVQGNTSALKGTPWRSTGSGVNHYVHVSRGREYARNSAGVLVPGDVLVFDPAADGRSAAWGRADQGPSWWTWSTLLRFAAALHPWGEGDPRVLGPGKMYAGCSQVADFRPAYGGVRTSPFPDRTRAKCPPKDRVNVRSAPTHHYDNVVGKLKDGELFVAYQRTTKGSEFAGSTRWYGNRLGTEWVHEARLTHEGGGT